MDRDTLGDRMKGYESVSRPALMRRCPAIVRVDGRAFHTWTRGCAKPFDQMVLSAMLRATIAAAEEMQGCKLAYVQSDEASFLLTDYDTLETQPWFGYDLSKVVSLSASIFTAEFNKGVIMTKPPATFDARAFNVPHDEVANYFLWRAKDWRRNSIQMLAQAHFSQRQLDRKKQGDMLAMLAEKGIDWSALPDHLRCGRFYLPLWQETVEDVEPHYPVIAELLAKAMERPSEELEEAG